MDCNIISNNRCKSSNLFLLNKVIHGRIERYDASQLLRQDFCKSTDFRNSIELKLGNQIASIPFEYTGRVFECCEMLYLYGL